MEKMHEYVLISLCCNQANVGEVLCGTLSVVWRGSKCWYEQAWKVAGMMVG